MNQKSERSFRGPVGHKILNLVAPVMRKRGGSVFSQLVLHWEKIVGTELSDYCAPEKVSFPQSHTQDSGILHVRVWDGKSMEIQYHCTGILDRINGYFGYQAIAKLFCKQVRGPQKQNQQQSPRKPS